MSETIKLTLDGVEVEADPGETIWQVAKRQGTLIPHLCHMDAPGYRSDGNCRACMVEIDGERVLAASCIRPPTDGMVVSSQSDRAARARRMVIEMLVADQPARETAHDKSSHLWDMAEMQGVATSRFPAIEKARIPLLDDSHVAMRVNLDACIHCNLCVRACREVQVNDVIGMAGRGRGAEIVFDMNDPMGASTCVACGECVQACPTGALMPATVLDAHETGDSKAYDREVSSVCPYCGVGCQLSFKIKDDRIVYVEGIDGPANQNRLCVKGRFGFDYVAHAHRLTKPLIRRVDAPAKGLDVDPANPFTHFREATWEEALDAAAGGLARLRDAHGGKSVAGFGSAKCSNEEAYLFQKLIRQGFGHNNVDHCTRLCHASSVAALIENVGSAAVTATFNEIENADVAIAIGCNPIENHPVAATYFKQFTKRGGKLIVIDPRGVGLGRYATHRIKFRPGTDVALLNAIMHVIVEEELYDRQYVEAMTEGFEEMKEHLRGFSPEKMADLCGVDAETLRDVARIFARAEAAMIFWGMGISQHIHGTDNSRCLISLALMCGQVGRPGTGLHPLRGQNNVQGASDAGLIPMFLPDYQSVKQGPVRDLFKDIWGTETNPEPGLTVVEIMDAVHDGQIKGMYILGENPAMSDPGGRARPPRAGEARASGDPGHLPDRDRQLCRRDPARHRLGREDRHRDQHQPPGPDGPSGGARARRGARGLGDHRRSGQPAGAGLGLHPPARDFRRDEARDGIARQHHLGAARARERGHLPVAQPGGPGPADRIRRRLPASRGPGEVHARQHRRAGRGAGRGVPSDPDHGSAARALAHRLDDPALLGARRGGAGSQRLAAPGDAARHGRGPGRDDPDRDPARRHPHHGPGRPDGGRGHGVCPLRLRRGRGQRADQPPTRPHRQDPRVQVRGL